MYSQTDAEFSNCVKVSVDDFPEIHWEPNSTHYWACNVLSGSNNKKDQVCEQPQDAQYNPHSDSQGSSFSSASTVPSTSFSSCQHSQYQTAPMNSTLSPSVQHAFQVNHEFRMPMQSPQFLHRSNYYNSNFNGQPHHIVPRSSHIGQSTNFSRNPQAFVPFVKTPNGTVKPNIVKRKRKRTMFTTEQIAVLENFFMKKPYISREERVMLVDELQINERSIKVWFQNRRLKDKRIAAEAAEAEQEMYYSNSPSVSEPETIIGDRLAYVESLMEKPDENGYVTLDDRALGDLAAVIDDVLPKNIQFHEMNTPTQVQESTYSYEPISPAATDNSSNESPSTYHQFESTESLQRFLDLQPYLIFNNNDVKA